MYPYILALIVVLLDQITKLIVVALLKPIFTQDIIHGVLSFKYTENIGVAFGLFGGGRIFFIISTLIIIIAIGIFIEKFKYDNLAFTLILTLVLGGAAGNLIDRIHYGYVVDFVYVHFLPYIFNIADCFLIIGAILISAYLVFFEKELELISRHGK